MSEWSKVVTNPLGLVGFSLFLVFGYLAKVKRTDERRWLAPVSALFAFAALAGGLIIAFLAVPKTPPPPPCSQVQQSSTGAGSPNVQCVVDGNVIITVDQSQGKKPKQ